MKIVVIVEEWKQWSQVLGDQQFLAECTCCITECEVESKELDAWDSFTITANPSGLPVVSSLLPGVNMSQVHLLHSNTSQPQR